MSGPRSLWNGTISFGLISVAVKVFSASEDRRVHFHQVHVTDGARIAHKRICSKDGKEVPASEVAQGYEVSDGEYVLLSREEIAAAAGDGAHRVALEEFVAAGDIDPDFYERTYYLGAGNGGQDAYRLLHDALARSGRAGLGRWVFHNREYLVAVRAHDALLLLHTMRFADELVAPGDIDVARPSRVPNKREAKMAAALVDSLHAPFAAEDFADSQRKAVLALIRAKSRGKEIDVPDTPAPEAAPDLMAALEASLEDRPKKKRSSSTKAKRAPARKGGTAKRARKGAVKR